MTELARERIRVRTAALDDAISAGDLRGASRAAARLRLRGVKLDEAQTQAGRTARREMGRALLAARWRASGEDKPRLVPVHGARRAGPGISRRLLGAAAAVALLIGVLAIVLNLGGRLGGELGDRGGATPGGPPDRVFVGAESRGRTFGDVNYVAVREPIPSTAPSPVIPTATPRPARTSAPGGTGQPGAPGPITGEQGSGGLLPFEIPPGTGYVRYTVYVYDGNTHQLLASGCPVLGTFSCESPNIWRQAGRGIWYADVAKLNGISWAVSASAPGYQTAAQQTERADRDHDFYFYLSR